MRIEKHTILDTMRLLLENNKRLSLLAPFLPQKLPVRIGNPPGRNFRRCTASGFFATFGLFISYEQLNKSATS